MTDAPDTGRMSSEESVAGLSLREFLSLVRTSGMWRLLVMLFMYIAGFGFILPFVPNLMTDFFASQAAGHTVTCEGANAGDEPPLPCCIIGTDRAVAWSSYTSFATNTILLFFLAPLTGLWSDLIGRKPFLIAGQIGSLIPKFVLFLNITSGLSLYLYYPADVLNGAISPLVATLACVADLMPPRYRAAGFGLVTGIFGAGIAFTPKIGTAMGYRAAVFGGVGLKILGLLYTAAFVRESVTPGMRSVARAQLEAKAAEARGPLWHDSERGSIAAMLSALPAAAARGSMRLTAVRYVVRGLAIVARNGEFMKLAAALAVTALVLAGLSDVDSQYFLTRLHFQQSDFATMFLIFGASALVVQVVFLPLILSLCGQKGALVIGSVAMIARSCAYALAGTKAQVFAAAAWGNLATLVYPAVSSLKANALPEHEQGAVQGALSGVQALAQGVGPLIFMRLYRLWTRDYYMPQMVQYVAALIGVVPLLLILSLSLPRLRRWATDYAATSAPAATAGLASEPLLPPSSRACEAAVAEGGRPGTLEPVQHPTEGHPSGTDVMAVEATVFHREASLSAGFYLEGEALQAAAARQPGR